MVKLFLFFGLLNAGKVVSAQTSATATATIVHSVGAEELQSEAITNAALLTVDPGEPQTGKKGPLPLREFGFTTFRITGSAFVFSMNIEPDQTAGQPFAEKKQLNHFWIRPVVGKPEAFTLGSRVNVDRVRKGEYDRQTNVDVVIHFN